eukprot:TRINITY_DN54_c0_g1_i1.p1 TRINITY_DN54_c0_g1~~TRINITY_DN54_c0_g1_i1.p1  ORF type:complete len:300 (-),score=99.81 TRINITY_DN54_c0_g1_i1:221-1051(-)
MCIRDRWYQRRVHGDKSLKQKYLTTGELLVKRMRTQIFVALSFLIAFTCAQKWVRYSVDDPRWKDATVGGSGTFHDKGSLVTSVAMVLTAYNKPCGQSPCHPKALNDWLLSNNGFNENFFSWTAIGKLGFRFKGLSTDKSQLAKFLQIGDIVLLDVRKDNKDHWVVATAAEGNNFVVLDPVNLSQNTYPLEAVRRGAWYKKDRFQENAADSGDDSNQSKRDLGIETMDSVRFFILHTIKQTLILLQCFVVVVFFLSSFLSPLMFVSHGYLFVPSNV